MEAQAGHRGARLRKRLFWGGMSHPAYFHVSIGFHLAIG